MKKRLVAITVCFMFVFSIMATVVYGYSTKETPVTFTVEADKTQVNPGDTVNFKVYLQQQGNLGSMQFDIDIPEGSTYVANSGKITDGLAEKFGWTGPYASISFTEKTKRVVGFGTTPFTGEDKEWVLTYQCKIDESAEVKDYQFGLKGVVVGNENAEARDFKVDTATVKVVPVPKPATGIKLDKTTLSLKAGGQDKLTATVTPEDSTDVVEWSSSDEKIAKVSNDGTVTAVAVGTATITAKAGEHSATCDVTVDCAHEKTTKVTAEPSTCEKQGHGAYTKCNDCGKVIEGSDALLPLADHKYGNLIPEVPAKCGVDGKKAHYQCSVCKKLFDEDKHETTEEDLVIKALEHVASDWKHDETSHWKECTVCGELINDTKANHDLKWIIDKEPTEDETGLRHQECTVCGYVCNENNVIDKLPHKHTGITHHEAVAATCHTKGSVEYWTCSSPKCDGKFYGDENCYGLISDITTPIDPNNHDGGTEGRNAVAPTCTEPGKEADTYCLGCGEKIADGKVIDPLGHDFSVLKYDKNQHWYDCSRCNVSDTKESHKGGEATCSESAVCEVCSQHYGAINPANHKNTEVRNAKEATETTEGYTGDTWCLDCNKEVKKGSVIPKLTHKMTHHAAMDSTCSIEGNIEYWSCSNPECEGKYYADEKGEKILKTVSIPVNPDKHTGETVVKDAVDATCTAGGYTGDTYCKGCDVKLSNGKAVQALGHNFKDGVCTVCGTKDTNAVKDTTKKPDIPTTGDNNNLGLLFAIMMLSGLTVVVASKKYNK